ncbi:glycosyltransferase family 4 protein [Lactobacillus sp. CC-MHH1034]|uniref:glycosyltransferase family 4 protein n=1 Tax=Agrilactobacillus fermenti TaxID=2586909 RepID=UPI001E2CE689|nr:glycosyltransferase family 4 protein [Agrilactobacillus fermenti]MCD2257514.1 glycosyltransferase family 4 protein [Agrilactobacillus fermenti]
MKICLVHEEYPITSNFGGIATYQYTMAKILADSGNKVTVICRSEKPTRKIYSNNFNIIPIYIESFEKNKKEGMNKFRLAVCKHLLKLQREDSVDIVETPDWGASCVYFQENDNRNIPIVVKLHTPLFVWEKFNRFQFNKEYREETLRLEREQIINSDALISCTKNLLDLVVDEYKLRKNTGKVILNPLSENKYINRNVSTYSEDIVNVTYVGSLEERKGVLALSKALSSHPSNFRKFVFNFVGKDTNRNYYMDSTMEEIKKELKGTNINIHFYGQKEHSKAIELMEKADVLIFPSLYDNLPYVILEAISLGKPVISSNRGGIPEIITNKQSGILIDPMNAADYISAVNFLRPLSTRKKIGITAKRVAKNYSESKVLGDVLVNYADVIDKYKIQKLSGMEDCP